MVKDLQDFLLKVQADKALQEKMAGIIKASKPENIFANCNVVAAEMGYHITQEDLQAFADEHKQDLKDEDLDKVAGGTGGLVASAFVTLSVAMALSAAASYCIDEYIHDK